VLIDTETAEVDFTYSYNGFLSANSIGHEICGTGKMYFLKAKEFWYIKDVDMKGVS
jgi:hypothetical protein